MIYEKTLKISHLANNNFSQGEIVNFIEVDSEKIINLMREYPQVAKLPMSLFFAWGLLIYFFGVSILGPALIITVVLSVIYLLSFWNASLYNRMLGKKDLKMNFTTESINNIKTVKLSLLYDYFLQQIKGTRDKELYLIKLKYVIEAIELFITLTMSPLLILSTFSIMFMLGRSLELSIAFAAIQMFTNLEFPIRYIKDFVKTIIEFNLSMKRIYKYLNCEESSPLSM